MNIAAGYQNWRDLLFLHWRVPAAALRPLVPRCMDLDEFDGAAFVGLVPFVVEAARPFGVPARLGTRFLETNVRTYVRLNGREPGVYFFSLDAASLLAVIGARVLLGLPYFWASGDQRASGERARQHVTEYQLTRRVGRQPRCRVRYRKQAYLGPAQAGTLEHFLVERYLLHVQRGPTIWSVRVRHAPYPLHRADLDELEENLVHAAGVEPRTEAPLVHFASGVDVAISPPRIRRVT